MPQPQKRSFEEAESFLEGVKVILLDIEGTILPINFVKDKLVPYVNDNIETYLKGHYDEEEIQKDISDLRDLAAKDKTESKDVVEIPACADGNKDEVITAVVANVKPQMEADRKSTELKQFQGHIWREAYKTKAVEAELFEDVIPVLQQLHDEQFKLFIYSSGSVEAQKLLVTHTTDGDIAELFDGYFDTTSGSKVEAESYRNIKKEVDPEGNFEPDEILFLTDNPEGRLAAMQKTSIASSLEATAACEAGLQSVIVDRSIEQEGGIEIDDEVKKNFPVIDNLNELFGEDDEDEDDYGQVKRPHMAGNGEYDDIEDDEDDVEGLDGEEDEEGDGDLGEDDDGEGEEEEEEA